MPLHLINYYWDAQFLLGDFLYLRRSNVKHAQVEQPKYLTPKVARSVEKSQELKRCYHLLNSICFSVCGNSIHPNFFIQLKKRRFYHSLYRQENYYFQCIVSFRLCVALEITTRRVRRYPDKKKNVVTDPAQTLTV